MRRTIYCPQCARELYEVKDDRQTIEIITHCKCGRYFKVDPRLRRATQIEKPARMSSSGATFY